MLDNPILSKQNSGLNRYSEFIETEITEEDDELSIDSKMNQYDSSFKERLMTYENDNTETNIKLSVNSTKDSQSNYWLKIKKSNTRRNYNRDELKEHSDKVTQLKKILKEKKSKLRTKMNRYNDIKRTNIEMKKMILIKIASLNS